MNNKKILIIFGLSFILLLLIVLIFINTKKKSTPPIQTPVVVKEEQKDVAPIVTGTSSVDQFRSEVPVDTKVPSVGAVLTEAEKKVIAVPTIVVATAPGASAQLRNFNITAEGGKFVPAEVIANVGDTIHINFTAVDRDYDIVFPSYGMKQTASKGQTKILEFQANTSGSFLYYCEACGGSGGSATGRVIIVK